MRKQDNDLRNYNFNFAWGNTDEGNELRAFVIRGKKRHNMSSTADYIRHCIKETSLLEEAAAKKQSKDLH